MKFCVANRARRWKLLAALICGAIFTVSTTSFAQDDLDQFDIDNFDHSAEGPWSDVDRTTLVVPRVANASVTLDGTVSSGEYGGFMAVDLSPIASAWVLDAPAKIWDGVEDSNAQFWLAHDDTYFYIAASVTDDVVNVDDASADNWKDDSIEVFFDYQNTKYDVRSGGNSPYGGHDGISADGTQRAWDYDLEEPNAFGLSQLATEVEWTNGPDGDVWAVGTETDQGYAVEMRYNKRMFEDPELGNKLENDYVMGFNLAVDDDDAQGPGENGSGDLDIDFELAYYWSQRERLIGWTAEEAEFYTEEEIAAGEYEQDYDLVLNPAGRLSNGAMGEIIFSDAMTSVAGDCDGDGQLGAGDLGCVANIEERDAVLGALNTILGDLDGNGEVAFADFLVLSANFGSASTKYSDGNIDLVDGVAFADFLSLSANFGQTAGGALSVPEPTAHLLCLFLVVVLPCLRQRR